MVNVRVNGEESGIQNNASMKVADLIELIKSSIDPDHIITAIQIDGKELEDRDWVATLNQYQQTTIIEVLTGTPANYVAERMKASAEVVATCYFQFRDARKKFQAGDMTQGNKQLVKAVGTLKAFFDWYGAIIALVPEQERSRYDLAAYTSQLAETCKQICQQQLYQSWWALGETLANQIEPQLDKLEDVCRGFSTAN